jgi:hypothetical protein
MAINYVTSQAANVTTTTTVYNPTTTAVQATLTGGLLCNKTASPITVSVALTNAGATVTTYIVYNIPIQSGNTLDFVQAAKINVPYNYVVSVTSTGAVDVTLSASESS